MYNSCLGFRDPSHKQVLANVQVTAAGLPTSPNSSCSSSSSARARASNLP